MRAFGSGNSRNTVLKPRKIVPRLHHCCDEEISHFARKAAPVTALGLLTARREPARQNQAKNDAPSPEPNAHSSRPGNLPPPPDHDWGVAERQARVRDLDRERSAVYLSSRNHNATLDWSHVSRGIGSVNE